MKESANFSSVSSKYQPTKTKQQINWSHISFMTDVHGTLKNVFNTTREITDPGYGKDSSQDAERKLVTYLYDTVITTISGVSIEKLHNTQQFKVEDREKAEQNAKDRVTGEVHIFTEMSPCSGCDNAIKKLKGLFPNLTVNVQYGVKYAK